ncbi:hypothetical protein GALMADRAFT_133950 [Galerina marginata CBS 339.88]|uniref:Uncharacterized protein n=1 Tax=Galerina marginata (strain CBS 339.88) TaxID=685588 RepID=A0A067TGM3_GALM3|nr:hypothetical protein GALMADRAFT_133950 [Galerina marginata CBS 339.88]
MPTLMDPLVNTASATFELFLLQSTPRANTRLPDDIEPDWNSILAPRTFTDIFPFKTPEQLIQDVTFNPDEGNPWLLRMRHILLCQRQLGVLIDLIEELFRCLGFTQGLKEFMAYRVLNTYLDYDHCPLLQSFEAKYLGAAYEFFLRERETGLARYLLNIIVMPFHRPIALSFVVNQILVRIEPANEGPSLEEDDDEFFRDAELEELD